MVDRRCLLAITLSVAGAVGGCTEPKHRIEVHQTDCAACHVDDYEATLAPPHPGLFPQLCAKCHDVSAWIPARPIAHDGFVLRFIHATTPCGTCHTRGYRPGDTSSACVSCHRDDYDRATAPPHVGMPTSCELCHTDAGWRPATFTHVWPLDGAHATAACAACHAGDPPQYRGVPRECVGCHRADYDASPYPGHSAFPTTCRDCHSTTAWRPALAGTHPDDRFPLSRGPHGAFGCTDCHNPALGPSTAGANTDCIGCHTGEHNRARMDDKHRDERDYPVGDPSPNFCLRCHPAGTK